MTWAMPLVMCNEGEWLSCGLGMAGIGCLRGNQYDFEEAGFLSACVACQQFEVLYCGMRPNEIVMKHTSFRAGPMAVLKKCPTRQFDRFSGEVQDLHSMTKNIFVVQIYGLFFDQSNLNKNFSISSNFILEI